jgi:hypothetical protein
MHGSPESRQARLYLMTIGTPTVYNYNDHSFMLFTFPNYSKQVFGEVFINVDPV